MAKPWEPALDWREMPVAVDDSSFPLVVYQWPIETTDAEVQDFLDHSETLLRNGHKHVMLLDMRLFAVNTAKQRRMAADWLQTHAEQLRILRCGVATLFAGPEAAGTMRSVYWQTPPPYPWHVTDSPTDAVNWLLEQLKRNNVAPPKRAPVIK